MFRATPICDYSIHGNAMNSMRLDSNDPLAGVTMRCHRILLTGASGNLGKILRVRLRRYADIVRVSDVATLERDHDQEEVVRCDLADTAAVDALVQGGDAIVHFGGVSVERPFEEILPANIQGRFNIYEGARRKGVRRVVFASSNHVIGYYRQGEMLDADVPPRPDGYYAVSKAFGEQLSRFYFDRYGIETSMGCPQTKIVGGTIDTLSPSVFLPYRALNNFVRRWRPRGLRRRMIPLLCIREALS